MQRVEAFDRWWAPRLGSRSGMGEAAYRFLAKERARKIQPWIARQHRVFEYGVGNALNLAAVKCRERYGWDNGAHFRAGAERQGIRWVRAIEEIPDAAFDVVICHHALQQVSEPGLVLQLLSRILRPDGALLLFAPGQVENLLASTDFQVESLAWRAYGYENFAAAQASRWSREWVYRATLSVLRALRPVQEVRVVARKPA